MFQHNHVAPNGVGTAFLLRAEKILEVVDEREIQLFQRNILTLVGMRQELTDMFANGHIALECPPLPCCVRLSLQTRCCAAQTALTGFPA